MYLGVSFLLLAIGLVVFLTIYTFLVGSGVHSISTFFTLEYHLAYESGFSQDADLSLGSLDFMLTLTLFSTFLC